ncbi:hypothetical protein UY286_21675 [Paenibacillus polymyxa]|uniref:hypothetical protein n=1 Tax=Paenibacillus polymyxa TaxID=1406 RepID=UPI002AB5DAA6|nr:hypothetical protein [Paenibacillus polymyxa]MDY7993349.1 hypothetical protein [Paenibacillus polymyxa]MDY8120050.1 hypothetical protein [Paenibacillus polymyxa]
MNNTEQQLFLHFYNSLAPAVQRDIKHYLFVYDMYLDEQDPKARETLLGEMNMLERKYNLEVTHGGNKNNQR